MENYLHRKCTSGGLCDAGCQKFIPQENSRRCEDCGHNDSKHIVLAVKVMMQGFLLLPRVPTESALPAEELRERVNAFRREKGADLPKMKEKVTGLWEYSNKVS